MNDLEARIREVLHEDASRVPFVGAMPELVRPRVRRRQVTTVVTASLAAVALIAGSVFVVRSFDRSAITPAPQPDGSSTPSSSPRSFPVGGEPVALEAGTYRVPSALAGGDYTVTVPDGWTGESGGGLQKGEDTPQGISVTPWPLDDIRILEEACRGELVAGPAPASAAQLVAALRAQGSGPIVSEPVATTVGELPATRVDLDYPDRMAAADCRIGTGQLQVWDGYFVFPPNYTASLYVVDVAGGSQVLLVGTADGASDADRAELQSVLDSIRFELVE